MKRKKYIGSALITILMVCLHSIPLCGLGTESNSYEKLAAEAMNSLEHGIAYYHSISIEGGYVMYGITLSILNGNGATNLRMTAPLRSSHRERRLSACLFCALTGSWITRSF